MTFVRSGYARLQLRLPHIRGSLRTMAQTSRMDDLFEAYSLAASTYERLLATPTSDVAMRIEYEQLCQELEQEVEDEIARLEASRQPDGMDGKRPSSADLER